MAGRPKRRARQQAAAQQPAPPAPPTPTPNPPPDTPPQATAGAEAPHASHARAHAHTDASASTGTRARKPAARKKPAAKKAAAKQAAKGTPARKRQAKVRRRVATADAREVERAIEESARAAGGRTAHDLTDEQVAERDAGIIAAHALSRTPSRIARDFGLSIGKVIEIVNAHREQRRRVPLPPSAEILRDTLEQLEAQMQAVLEISEDADAMHTARVGAVRTWRELLTNRLELLQAMNLLSIQPSAEDRERRAGEMLRALLSELRLRGVDDAVLQEAADQVLNPQGAGPNVHTIEARARTGA